MSKKGVSIVADHVLVRDYSETDIIDKLRPYATLINVHTLSSDPVHRYIKRINLSDLPSIINRRQHLFSLAASHAKNLDKTEGPLKLNVPQLVVSTDDGYAPEPKEIVAFINTHRYGKMVTLH